MGSSQSSLSIEKPVVLNFSQELFNDLPLEIQDEILICLDWTDLHNCWKAGWKELFYSNHNYAWKHLLYRHIVVNGYQQGFFSNHCQNLLRKYRVRSIGLTLLKICDNLCFTCTRKVKLKQIKHPLFNFAICNRCRLLDPRFRMITEKQARSFLSETDLKSLSSYKPAPSSEYLYLEYDVRNYKSGHTNKLYHKNPQKYLTKHSQSLSLITFFQCLPIRFQFEFNLEINQKKTNEKKIKKKRTKFNPFLHRKRHHRRRCLKPIVI